MIAILIIILGALTAAVSYKYNSVGHNLWRDISLGIAGSIGLTFIVTVAYMFNFTGKADVIGLNWYCLTSAVLGALLGIHGKWLIHKIQLMEPWERVREIKIKKHFPYVK